MNVFAAAGDPDDDMLARIREVTEMLQALRGRTVVIDYDVT